MKDETSSDEPPNFVPYDDENLAHVSAGPDYGQVDSGSKKLAWDEISSAEYPDYILEVAEKIVTHPLLKIVVCHPNPSSVH